MIWLCHVVNKRVSSFDLKTGGGRLPPLQLRWEKSLFAYCVTMSKGIDGCLLLLDWSSRCFSVIEGNSLNTRIAFFPSCWNIVNLNHATIKCHYPHYQSVLTRTLLRFCGSENVWLVETAVYFKILLYLDSFLLDNKNARNAHQEGLLIHFLCHFNIAFFRSQWDIRYTHNKAVLKAKVKQGK